MATDGSRLLDEILDRCDNWFAQEGARDPARMTRDLYPYTAMFEPIRVNRLTLKNRLVMGPMGNIAMAEELGRPGSKMIAYFAERARGGVGLITSGLVPVAQHVDPSIT